MNAVIKGNIVGLKGILVYLSGPLANIMLAIIFRNIRMVYEINMALALINLMPINPLDGYNILKLILVLRLNKQIAKKLIRNIEKCTEILLSILAVFMSFKYYNFSLFLLLVYIKANSLHPLKSL